MADKSNRRAWIAAVALVVVIANFVAFGPLYGLATLAAEFTILVLVMLVVSVLQK